MAMHFTKELVTKLLNNYYSQNIFIDNESISMILYEFCLSKIDHDLVTEAPEFKDEQPEVIFKAGQSKRVWGELYKVCCHTSCGFSLNMHMY